LSGRIFDEKGSVYLKWNKKIDIDSVRQPSNPGSSGKPNHGNGKQEYVRTLSCIDPCIHPTSGLSRKRTDKCRIVMYRRLGEDYQSGTKFLMASF